MILNISNQEKINCFQKKSKQCVIYKITNLLNDDFYIGSTINLYQRYRIHLRDIKNNKKTCTKLVRAVNKYKKENFSLTILATSPKEYLLKLEQWFIDNLKPKYNIAPIAGSNFGIKRTEETKLKNSISQKNVWKNEDYRKHSLENLSKNWKAGEKHVMSKVTDLQVIEIKKQLLAKIKMTAISKNLNISLYIIKDIKRGRTWNHIKI